MVFRKNKAKINELKNSWKIGKDYDMLTKREKANFIWWVITGNPKYLYFLYMQVIWGKHARASYDDAISKDKTVLLITLANAGYYYQQC